MKNFLLIAIASILVIGMMSCGLYTRYVDRDYFKEDGGIVIDKSVKNNDGTWFLPIKFETRIINSAHVIADISACTKNNTITMRVLIGLAQAGHKWPEGVNLGKLSDGVYQIKYLNSDGSTPDIDKIEINN